eukprot:TRINITY_DN135076_c2_g1_i1.p1 TRINITY_DN135076_c2_g1~~TRINITY_DN135076_c2_g1_i1.p1  ORF type:complete len:1694 (-),score=130.78 TRINITY_DN135076_c2_g1_i1:1451-6472(-)
MDLFRHEFASDLHSHSKANQSIWVRLKISLYAFYGKLLANYFTNQFFYICMLLLELSELMYYPLIILRPDLDALYHIFEYESFVYIFATACGTTLLYLLLFFLLWSLAYCSTVGKQRTSKKSSASEKSMHSAAEWREYLKFWFRFYGFLLNLYVHLLFLPIAWICIVPLSPESDGFFTNNPALIAISILTLLVGTILCGITTYFYHDEGLSSDLPWTLLPLLANLMKLLKKVVFAAAFTYSRDIVFEVEVLLVVCAISFIELLNVVRSQQMPKKWSAVTFILCEVSIFAFSVLALVNSVSNEFMLDYPAFLLAMMPTILILALLIKYQHRLQVLSDPALQREPEEYVRQMASLLQKESKNNIPPPSLIGYLRHHCSSCVTSECPCKNIDICDKDETEEYYFRNQNVVDKDYDNNIDLGKVGKFRKTFYTFLNYLVKSGLDQTEKEAKPYILSAEIQLNYLQNKFQALYDLQEAQECNMTLYEEYSVYRIRNEIEIRIIENNLKSDTLGNGAVERWIQFQEKFIKFHDLITDTTEIYIKFWKELLKDNSEYLELTNLGYKIAVNLDKVHSAFESILQIVQNSVKASIIYTLFLYNVVKDTFSAHERYLATRLTMDSYYINKKRWESVEGKYGEDSASAVVLISGNKSNVGRILNTNHELYEMLGHEKKSVLGQNVSVFIPELIAVYHNRFIQGCFTNSLSTAFNSKERLVLPQHSAGYLVPCTLLTRLVPNLDKGIQFIGFLNKATLIDEFRKGESRVNADEVIILLLDNEMKMHGFNRRFLELLACDLNAMNIHKYLDADRKIDLVANYPEVFAVDNMERLESDEGEICSLDISKIVEQLQEEVVNELEAIHKEKLIETIKAHVKLKEYKHGSLRYYVCTIASDIINSRFALFGFAGSPTNGDDVMENEAQQRKADQFEIHDDASISQTTSSNFTQSDNDVRTIRDFRGHIKEKKDPYTIQCFRYASYILLILLLTIYGVIYALKRDLVTTFEDGFLLMIEEYQRLDRLLSVVHDTRTLRNIYFKIQLNNSEVVPDRSAFYFHTLKEEAGELLSVHESLINRQHKGDLFKSAFEKYDSPDAITLISVDKWDGYAVTQPGMRIHASLGIAVRQIVTKITDVVGLPLESYKERKVSQKSFDKWDREAAFVIHNSIYTLLPILDESSLKIVDLLLNKGNEQEGLFVGVTFGLAGSVIVSLLLLLPFIYRAHRGVVVVFNLFLKLPKKEVRELIKCSEKYQKQVNKHFEAIIKHFNEIDFRDELNAEKDAIIEAGKLGRAKASSRQEKPLEVDSIEEENKGLSEEIELDQKRIKEQLEEMDVKRKIARITAASTGSRNKLMVEIIGMALIFGIYFSITLALRITYFTKMEGIVKILNVIAHTKPLVSYAMMYSIEDFSSQKVTYVDEDNEIAPGFERHFQELLDNELESEILENEINRYFPELSAFKHEMDSDKLCDLIKYEKSYTVSCEEAYHGILTHGFQNCLNQITLEMYTIYNQFLNAHILKDTTYISALLKNIRFTNILDINSVFLSVSARLLVKRIRSEGLMLFSESSTFDTYDFIIFGILLTVMLLAVLSWFLGNFKHSIWRTKRMLGIMPTKYIAGQLDDVKVLIRQISQSFIVSYEHLHSLQFQTGQYNFIQPFINREFIIYQQHKPVNRVRHRINKDSATTQQILLY